MARRTPVLNVAATPPLRDHAKLRGPRESNQVKRNCAENGVAAIGFILELLLTALWEIFLQIVSEVLLGFGLAAAGEPLRQRTHAHPVLASAGMVLLGALAGAFTSWVWPARILQPGPVRGASLVLSPLVTGAIMDRYGTWREDRGQTRSYIATFWGGALFAFSMAVERFVWVGAYSHIS